MFIACLRISVKANWTSNNKRKLKSLKSYENEGAMTGGTIYLVILYHKMFCWSKILRNFVTDNQETDCFATVYLKHHITQNERDFASD